MMKPIIGANRRETRIEIVLPVDDSGAYAYDEEGKPIKGRVPVVFTVPRFDCIERDLFKQMQKDMASISDKKDEDGTPLSSQDQAREMVFAMVRPFVAAEVLAVVQGLHLFELEQIAEQIQERSSVTVGELLASTIS